MSGTLVDFPGSRATLRVAIVGGGVTGLAAAYRLQEAAAHGNLPRVEIRVLEASGRPGGLVRTETVSGLVLETGADSMIAQKPAGLALAERLGLGDEIVRLETPRPTMQVVHRGRLVDLPAGFLLLAPSRLRSLLGSRLFSWRGKLRMLAEPLVPRRSSGATDESLAAFVARRLGREALDRAAEPIVGGLYTADADRLSLAATMPRFLELERKHGSVVRGLRRAVSARRGKTAAPGFVWLHGGMERLVDRLVAALAPGTVTLGARVEGIAREAAIGTWRIETAGRPAFHADAVILAAPGFDAARLVAPVDLTLARDLAALDYASCATVHLLYRAERVRAPLSSYGFFVPRTAGLSILGCSYVSEKFKGRAPADRVLLRAFLGGARDPGILDRSDDERIETAHRTLAGLLQIEGDPEWARSHAHPRSMPQYVVGDRGRIERIDERMGSHPGLFVAGSVVGAVGLPDCIESGERTAARALSWLAAFRTRAARIAQA